MKLALGCDHGGFELKEAVRGYCEERQIPYEDFGAYSTESVDYAPIAAKAARSSAKRKGFAMRLFKRLPPPPLPLPNTKC